MEDNFNNSNGGEFPTENNPISNEIANEISSCVIRTKYGEIDVDQYIELERQNKENDYIKKSVSFKKNKNFPLHHALLGMIFSFFLGFGLGFSIYAFANSLVMLKSSKSQSLVWARNLAIIGMIMNLVILVCFIIFASNNFYFEPLVPSEPIFSEPFDSTITS